MEESCHRTDSAFIPHLELAIRMVGVLLRINDDDRFIYRLLSEDPKDAIKTKGRL